MDTQKWTELIQFISDDRVLSDSQISTDSREVLVLNLKTPLSSLARVEPRLLQEGKGVVHRSVTRHGTTSRPVNTVTRAMAMSCSWTTVTGRAPKENHVLLPKERRSARSRSPRLPPRALSTLAS